MRSQYDLANRSKSRCFRGKHRIRFEVRDHVARSRSRLLSPTSPRSTACSDRMSSRRLLDDRSRTRGHRLGGVRGLASRPSPTASTEGNGDLKHATLQCDVPGIVRPKIASKQPSPSTKPMPHCTSSPGSFLLILHTGRLSRGHASHPTEPAVTRLVEYRRILGFPAYSRSTYGIASKGQTVTRQGISLP